jgi:hypothetical protein
MGQWVDPRAVDREVRVKQMRKPNALRLGRDPKRVPIAVEAKGSGRLDKLKSRLGVAEEKPCTILWFIISLGGLFRRNSGTGTACGSGSGG